MREKNRYEVISLDALDALIDAKLSGRPKAAAEIAALAKVVEEQAKPKELHARRFFLDIRICTCERCQRSWSQEDGLYLLSESWDGHTKELVLVQSIEVKHNALPIEVRNQNKRTFPVCIRCFKDKPQ